MFTIAVKLTFFQPMKYAYEAIMTNEFRTLDLECSDLVPLGPGCENVTLENQFALSSALFLGNRRSMVPVTLSLVTTTTGVTCGG